MESGCEFGFSARLDLVPKGLLGIVTLQLDFATRVPWVLAEAEPMA